MDTRLTYCTILFLVQTSIFSQNLLTNGSAEGSAPTSMGWTNVQTGNSCFTSSGYRILGNQNGFPLAQNGSYLFFAGCDMNGEIYQSVDVSAYASAIDAGIAQFTFSGYTHSYNQSPADGARIVVQYRNVSNVVLVSYNTGVTTNTSNWVQYTDTRIAPVGTRFIRVRLISTLNNGSSNDGYFDNIVLSAPVILPVELTGFQVKSDNCKTIQLEWATASERDNSHFVVERSSDGMDWLEIGVIPGNNNSTQLTNYRFEDQQPHPGENYYRLNQVDFSGSSAYSPVRALDCSTIAGGVKAYPNPVKGVLHLNLPDQDASVSVQLINSLGYCVFQESLSSNISGHIVDCSSFSKGIYALLVQIGNKQLIKRIVIE